MARQRAKQANMAGASHDAGKAQSQVPSVQRRERAQTGARLQRAYGNQMMTRLAQGGLPPSVGGQPLTESLRTDMETRFRTDFSSVRIHKGPEAAAIGADAFTRGEHIHFDPGAYDPASAAGRELIGHELAHVVQQRQGRVPMPANTSVPINASPTLEAEAEAAGARAAQTKHPAPMVDTVEGVAASAPSQAAPVQRGLFSRKKKSAKARQPGPADKDSLWYQRYAAENWVKKVLQQLLEVRTQYRLLGEEKRRLEIELHEGMLLVGDLYDMPDPPQPRKVDELKQKYLEAMDPEESPEDVDTLINNLIEGKARDVPEHIQEVIDAYRKEQALEQIRMKEATLSPEEIKELRKLTPASRFRPETPPEQADSPEVDLEDQQQQTDPLYGLTPSSGPVNQGGQQTDPPYGLTPSSGPVNHGGQQTDPPYGLAPSAPPKELPGKQGNGHGLGGTGLTTAALRNRGYRPTKKQAASLERDGLIQVPVLGDGNCLFNALIEMGFGLQGGVQPTNPREIRELVAGLRNAVANHVESMTEEEAEDFMINRRSIARQIRNMGNFDSDGGDIAPSMLARTFNISINIYNDDGSITRLNESRRPVFNLIRFRSGPHYDATRHT